MTSTTSSHSLGEGTLARGAAGLAAFLGALALLGWGADMQGLRTFGGSIAMNPLTALGILAACASLWLCAPAPPTPAERGLGSALAATVVLVGLLKLADYLLGWNSGLDLWLFAGRLAGAESSAAVRMAPHSALNLVLTGVALLTLDQRIAGGWRPAQVLALATAIVALPTVLGHLSGAPVFAEITPNRPMALNTALAFLLLSTGILAARPRQGLLAFGRDLPLRRQVNAAFGIAAAILVLMGSVSVWSSLRSEEAARERRASVGRRTQVEHLLGALQDAETGERGYLLTGDSVFLVPYHAVVHSFADRFRALRESFAPYPRQAARLNPLDSLVTAKLALLARTVELRRRGRSAAAVAMVATGTGEEIMNRVREIVSAIVQEERALYDVWDERLRRTDQLSVLTSAAGAVLAVTFLLLGAMAIHRTIARREAAEAALRDSEGRLVQLLEALPVAVYVLDGTGKPFYANQASRRILGRDIVPDATANQLSELYAAYVAGTDQPYPPDRQPIVHALAGQRARVTDIEIRRPDGVVPLEVWAAPVFDAQGRVAFAVAAFNDISERRRAEEAIRQLNRELAHRVRELTDVNHELEAFSYSVSHDLRAPLRQIDGFAGLLEELAGSRLDEKGGHYLRRVRDGARQAGVLIDDLLRLSRVSRQGLAVRRSDLNAIVRSVVYDLRAETEGRKIEWRIDRLPSIECDPQLVKQVLVNLLGNAVKFTRTRERAIIEVAATEPDAGPVVLVRDNGVGFDMTYADKLFGVFQRLHPQQDFEGTGVGLAIVQRIVHKHGGRVWAEAAVDQGATFYFTLGGRGERTGGAGREVNDDQ